MGRMTNRVSKFDSYLEEMEGEMFNCGQLRKMMAGRLLDRLVDFMDHAILFVSTAMSSWLPLSGVLDL